MTITRRSFIKGLMTLAATLGLSLPEAKAENREAELQEWKHNLNLACAECSCVRCECDFVNGVCRCLEHHQPQWYCDYTEFVDQPVITYLPDREHYGKYHVFHDGMLQSREGQGEA